MTGKGLWAELEFMEEAECVKMLKGEHILIFASFLSLYILCITSRMLDSGTAGEWTEHRQFLPSIEFCAAKVFSFICQIFILN